MRTDCKIDNEPIPCGNARAIGFGGNVAKVGNLIVYREAHEDGSESYRTARVLGRVSAPKTSAEDRPVTGFALVMTLSYDCTYASERWVAPNDIVEVREVPTMMLEFFARPTLPPVEVLRQKMEGGYIVNHYLAQSGLLNNKQP